MSDSNEDAQIEALDSEAVEVEVSPTEDVTAEVAASASVNAAVDATDEAVDEAVADSVDVAPTGAEVEDSADGSVDESSDRSSDESESVLESEDGRRPTSGRDRRSQLEREGEVAADFLESLLDICDLDGDLDVDIDGDRASVSLVDSDEGRVPRRLVGTQGQVLDALQELTRLAVQSQTGERSRLMLDIAGHRAQRRATLVGVAQIAIGKVKEGSEREALDPMTAFERKVVHDEVLAAGLMSESEGVEPRRFVVVLPA